MGNVYLIFILTVLIGEYFFNLIVEVLNIKGIKKELPEEFVGLYDEKKYLESQNYLKDNTCFKLIQEVFFTILTIVFILIGGFNPVDHWARSFGFSDAGTGLIFAGFLILVSQILHLPFSVYHTFIIEAKYGFNRTTPKTFVLDIIKGLILTAILGGLIFWVILWFFQKSGVLAWVYCWVAVVLFELILVFIAPILIMPLFNKFIPLEDGPLKNSINTYAKNQKFSLSGIFKIDGSRRSSKSNAFFTGFGKSRRIALFDTLIQNHTIEELVSILAHEIGHYKKKHIFKLMFLSVISEGLMFFILSKFINNPDLFAAFKMGQVSIYASLFFFAFLYSPIHLLFSVFSNIFSRRYEYQADAYAVSSYNNPEAMISALKKLSVNNLSNLTPHPWKVFLDYSHPPVLQRIKAIRN